MTLEGIGKLYDMMVESGVVIAAVVGNDKVVGLELTFADGSVEQKLFQSITVKEAETKVEEPNAKT